MSQDKYEFAAWVGIDWADQKHAVSLAAADAGGKPERRELLQTPEAIDAWVGDLRGRFGGRPVAVCLEQSKGALIFGLMKYDFLVLYPINPKQLARYREALAPSGAKDDPTDAELLREFLRHHVERLRAWRPDTAETRIIDMLSRDRRSLVDLRTKLGNELISRLKTYFPQALELVGKEVHSALACAFLSRWPTLAALHAVPPAELEKFYVEQGCRRSTIAERLALAAASRPLTTDVAIVEAGSRYAQALAQQLRDLSEQICQYDLALANHFAEHPDSEFFAALPGAGETLAPRLLAAFGSDRERFPQAEDLQKYTGVAPVMKRSGRTCHVERRWACPKYVRQTFHEFAFHSRQWSPWAKAYYRMQRARGKPSHTALRALAYKWIRVLHACWQKRTLYDELAYSGQLIKKNSPVVAYMAQAE